jgi:hypothetical protein
MTDNSITLTEAELSCWNHDQRIHVDHLAYMSCVSQSCLILSEQRRIEVDMLEAGDFTKRSCTSSKSRSVSLPPLDNSLH